MTGGAGLRADELRRRLADNLHYIVLGKLDEVHALVEARLTPTLSPS